MSKELKLKSCLNDSSTEWLCAQLAPFCDGSEEEERARLREIGRKYCERSCACYAGRPYETSARFLRYVLISLSTVLLLALVSAVWTRKRRAARAAASAASSVWVDAGRIAARRNERLSEDVVMAEYNGVECVLKTIRFRRFSRMSRLHLSTSSFDSLPSTTDLENAASADSPRASVSVSFRNQLDTFARFRNENLVPVLAAYSESNESSFGIVSELMRNGSLRDTVHNSPVIITFEMVVRILMDVVKGLEFLHDHAKQSHGAVRPSKILLDETFKAKLVFAHTRRHDARTPPESPVTDGFKADVYSFGMTMWELLYRCEPFFGADDLEEVLRRVRDEGYRPDVSEFNRPPNAHLLIPILVGAWHQNPSQRPTAKELREQLQRVLDECTDRAEKRLIDQILPPNVSHALLVGRKVVPETHDRVTIFFSDIVGFTELSNDLPPEAVVLMLDTFYSRLDTLCGQTGLFKVETIGDSYMCVGGLAQPQPRDHTARVAYFSMEAVKLANRIPSKADETIHIRTGFHTGPVVASVVGKLNPRYCLFGDTVNTASRMESHSLEDCINMSDSACASLREQVPDVAVEDRGLLVIKGKGDMRLYFLQQNATNYDRVRCKVFAP